MDSERKANIFEALLRWMCALLFLGYGLVTLQGRFSLRALFFQENWMENRVEPWFGMTWDKWVTDEMVGERIDLLGTVLGTLFILIAIFCLVPGRRWWTLTSYLVGCLLLASIAFIRFADSPVGIGMFLEHASQFITPLLLFLVVCFSWRKWMEGLARVAIAMTFFFHGLFAFGVTGESLGLEDPPLWMEHPTPATFTYMTMESLHLEDEGMALGILKAAGVIDFVTAALILLPFVPLLLPFSWMIVWGFLTALARPWAYFNPAEPLDSLWTWVPEFLLRTPHFALPILLLLRSFAPKPPPSPPKKHENEKLLIHEKPRVSTIDPLPDVRELVPTSDSPR